LDGGIENCDKMSCRFFSDVAISVVDNLSRTGICQEEMPLIKRSERKVEGMISTLAYKRGGSQIFALRVRAAGKPIYLRNGPTC